MAMMAINSEVEPSSNGLRLDLVQEMSAREGGTDYLHLENVEIGVSTYLEDFKTYLLPFIRPEWSGIELDNKVFDTGVTNILVAIFNKEKGLRESREDVVLVRVNGAKTENIVDRDDEVVFYQTLNRAGFCPPLYARLKNGLCYGFFPGRQLSLAEAREWKMCRKITRLLACLHCMEIPEHFQGRKPQLWAKIDDWLTKAPTKFDDQEKQKCFVEKIGSLDSLRREITWMRSRLLSSQFPLVLCHNDTLMANFILDEDTGNIGIVDFEYGGLNYLPFDIADHFCEFAGLDVVNYDLYPDESFQKVWLRMYLEERALLTGEGAESVRDDLVHSLYREVNKFSLICHLFWTVWALLQALYSTIDFNYVEYAGLRYEEYLRRKDSFSSI